VHFAWSETYLARIAQLRKKTMCGTRSVPLVDRCNREYNSLAKTNRLWGSMPLMATNSRHKISAKTYT
jgi:hypothetical protein